MRIMANRYRLEEPAGRGGFAVVHRACDRARHRQVTVKLLDSAQAGETLGGHSLAGRRPRRHQAAHHHARRFGCESFRLRLRRHGRPTFRRSPRPGVGTALYLAPEQLRGKRCFPPADVFAYPVAGDHDAYNQPLTKQPVRWWLLRHHLHGQGPRRHGLEPLQAGSAASPSSSCVQRAEPPAPARLRRA